VGVGYNYLSGQVFVPDVYGAGYTMDLSEAGGPTLEFTDPDLTFNWQSSVIDFKVQASKQFLVVTPFAGLGTSVGLSTAGGGLESKIIDQSTGNKLTEDDADQYEQDIKDAGFDAPELDPNQGIAIGSDVNGWGLRAFGGVGFNILALKLDLGLGYDVLGGNLMGSLSARFQL